MNSGIKIQIACPDDARGMQEVYYRTWLATYPNEQVGVTIDDIESKYADRFSDEKLLKRRGQLANPAPGHTFLVAKDGDAVVGLCYFIKTAEQNQLQAIYILPEYQGQGAGKLFWHEAEKYLDFSRDIIVSVATYNTSAISFYNKLGFVDTGLRREDEKFKMKSGVIIPEMEMVLKPHS